MNLFNVPIFQFVFYEKVYWLLFDVLEFPRFLAFTNILEKLDIACNFKIYDCIYALSK